MRTHDDRRSGRVLVGQVVVNFALIATYTGIIAVILPTRVSELDPREKVMVLGIVTSISFAVTAIAQPLVGALSDRTRTRFGRRLPWMAAGALIGGVAVGLVGGAPSVVVLGALWAVGQFALNGLEVSMDAYLVDAFAPERRGLAAGVVGVAVVAGAAAGAVLSGRMTHDASTATWVLAGSVMTAVGVFALLVRDPRSMPAARARKGAVATVRAVAARVAAHPDFVKVLLWRVGFSIAYGAVFGYLLYVLTDRVGLSREGAAELVGLTTIIGGAAAAISVVLGGWLSDRTRRRRPFLLLASAAIVLGDLLLLLWPTVPGALVMSGLFGSALGLSISCGRALSTQVLPDPERGAAAGLGVVNIATNIGQALAPPLAALLIGASGYPAIFVASMVLAAASYLPIALIRTVR